MALLRGRSSIRPGWGLGTAALASGLWLAQAAFGPAAGATLENAVKAAYLLKFAPFVDWPPRAFAGPASPFGVCILGPDPFGAALDQAVAGQRVGEHPVVVRRLSGPAVPGECHVLYAGHASERRLQDALAAMRGQPVLTVTERGQAGPGGVIRFLLQGGRVRFAIDKAAAQANGLSISSKLLSLAADVRR